MVDMLVQFAGFLIAAGAVYGGIRSDLRAMHRDLERQERAVERLHQRFDEAIKGAL